MILRLQAVVWLVVGCDDPGGAPMRGDTLPNDAAWAEPDGAGPDVATPDVATPDQDVPGRWLAGRVMGIDRPFGPAGFAGAEVARPAVAVEVEAVGAQGQVARTRTDAEGVFAIPLSADAGPLRIRARAQVQVAGLTADARDAAGALYAMETPEITGENAGIILQATGPAAAAFHIVEEARRALVFIAPAVGKARAHLTYRWQAGLPWPCGACYLPDAVLLGGGFEDPDEFDDAIILHELGHWFVDHFSADDSPGGAHRNLEVSPTLAYGEGVAYFFAALVQENPHLVDTFIDTVRHVDLEAVTVDGEAVPAVPTLRAPLREEVVAGTLWDFTDPPSIEEAFDTLAFGRAAMLALLIEVVPQAPDTGAPGLDLADWFHLLACGLGPGGLQSLADAHGFPWTADEAACGKGQVPTPFELVERAGMIWLEAPATLPPIVVRRGEKPQALQCDTPCPLGPADPDALIVVSAPGQPWPGRSWVGARRRAALAGGRLAEGLRILPAAGVMLALPKEAP